MIQRLIVFTRYPKPGTTKTRLIPALGSEGAADLQKRMTEHTLKIARDLRNDDGTEITVFYTGCKEAEIKEWLGDDIEYHNQSGEDLGQRLDFALDYSFKGSATKTIIIGIDCPDISSATLKSGFKALTNADLVIGPAEDGGFYLLGLNRLYPQLLQNIDWGTDKVLPALLKHVKSLNLKLQLLETLSDVDLPADLPLWQKHTQQQTTKKISVIIPTLCEESHIRATITAAMDANNTEIIVADGGSTDKTIEIAKDAGAKVISSEKGRAKQMNHGASAASGEILLFLHADTILPPAYDLIVRSVLLPKAIAGGAFHLSIKPAQRGTHTVEQLVAFRSAILHMPYGDQAIFMKRSTFRDLCGYRDMPIMEDFDMIRRLKRIGKISITSEPVSTSSRRWEELGIIRTTLINQLVIAGFLLGIAPQRLASFYRRQK